MKSVKVDKFLYQLCVELWFCVSSRFRVWIFLWSSSILCWKLNCSFVLCFFSSFFFRSIFLPFLSLKVLSSCWKLVVLVLLISGFSTALFLKVYCSFFLLHAWLILTPMFLLWFFILSLALVPSLRSWSSCYCVAVLLSSSLLLPLSIFIDWNELSLLFFGFVWSPLFCSPWTSCAKSGLLNLLASVFFCSS